MSPRDTLIEWGLSAREADEVLWDHAHELAEEIRERARRIEEVGGSATGRLAEDTAVRRRAWATVADLIDPEVTR